MDLIQQIDLFLKYLKDKKNASPYTINNYRADISKFIEYARREGVGEVLFSRVTPLHVRAYVGFQRNNHYASSTIARRIASLKSFFRFLIQEQLMEENPCLVACAPHNEKKVPVILSRTEVDGLLNLPDNTILGMRDKALLEILYATGMRVSEVVEISISDMDFVNCYVVVWGKRDKERVVPFGRAAFNAVQQYLHISRPKLIENFAGMLSDKLFVNNKGGPLTERSVRRIIAKYVTAMPIYKEVSPQTLRYTLAVHMLNNGADLKSVQQILGNINLSFAQIYTHVVKDGLKSVYKDSHPRA